MLQSLLRWDVNHLFILNVDPRCRVTPEFFFARAATLTTIWILIFGCSERQSKRDGSQGQGLVFASVRCRHAG